MIPILIDTFGMDPKNMEKRLEKLEIGGQIETIRTTVLLKPARILRRDLETYCDSGKDYELMQLKKFQGVNNKK